MGAMAVGRQPIDIVGRTFTYAVRVIRLVRAMPRDVGGQVAPRQLARSGTSVGANVEEAQAAQSRADFVRRMNIARAEAKGCLYWLRLAAESEILPRRRLQAILVEADEIIRVWTAIVSSARRSKLRSAVPARVGFLNSVF
jgi:four helix bundle protein